MTSHWSICSSIRDNSLILTIKSKYHLVRSKGKMSKLPIFLIFFILQNATVQLILVSNGSITFTVFLYGNINWSPTLQQPIASSWQCSEIGDYYNHPTSLHVTFPTVIGSSTNSSEYCTVFWMSIYLFKKVTCACTSTIDVTDFHKRCFWFFFLCKLI